MTESFQDLLISNFADGDDDVQGLFQNSSKKPNSLDKVRVIPTSFIVGSSKRATGVKFTLDEGWVVYLGDSMGIQTELATHVHIREETNGSNGIGINIHLLESLIISLKKIENIYSE